MDNLNKRDFICTGCFLCGDICPTNAIAMKEDEEGFYQYVIDEEKCIHCGLCVKKCPKIELPVFHNDVITTCYAAYSNDRKLVMESSSGGIFSVLANSILAEGGLVIGAAWENHRIQHIVVENKEDLYKLRSSKYLQSNLSHVYCLTKKALKEGKKVLFSGTPCQIGALQKMMVHPHLYTIDVVCHGVPAQKVFDQSIRDRFSSYPKEIHFRNKMHSWRHFCIQYDQKMITHGDDVWMNKFLGNYFLKRDCYHCPFVSQKRLGDISLGDFWGIDQIDPQFFQQNQDVGVSFVTLNNSKGKALFSKIEKTIVVKEQDPILANQYNPRIWNGEYDAHYEKQREHFYKQFLKGNIVFKNVSRWDKLRNTIYHFGHRVRKKIKKTFKPREQ